MDIVIKIMIFLLIVSPLSILVFVGYFPKKFYTVQKTILNKMIPESPEDGTRLIINGTFTWISIWSILAVFVSMIEGY